MSSLLQHHWLLVRDMRTVESSDPINYRWTESGLERIES
jgi:hypothetical protein